MTESNSVVIQISEVTKAGNYPYGNLLDVGTTQRAIEHIVYLQEVECKGRKFIFEEIQIEQQRWNAQRA